MTGRESGCTIAGNRCSCFISYLTHCNAGTATLVLPVCRCPIAYVMFRTSRRGPHPLWKCCPDLCPRSALLYRKIADVALDQFSQLAGSSNSTRLLRVRLATKCRRNEIRSLAIAVRALGRNLRQSFDCIILIPLKGQRSFCHLHIAKSRAPHFGQSQ